MKHENLIKFLSYRNGDIPIKIISEALNFQSFNDVIDGQNVDTICSTTFVLDIFSKQTCKLTFVDDLINQKLNYLNNYLNILLSKKDYLFFYCILRRIKFIESHISMNCENFNDFDKKIVITYNINNLNCGENQILLRRNQFFVCKCILDNESCYQYDYDSLLKYDDYNILTHRNEYILFRDNILYQWLKNDNKINLDKFFKKINYFSINYELKDKVIIDDLMIFENGNVFYRNSLCRKRRFLMKNGVNFEELHEFFGEKEYSFLEN